MSKRYGRNQKRRHKKEIADLRLAYASQNILLKHASEELAIAEQMIKDIIETIKSVSVNSIAIPPRNEAGSQEQDFYRIVMRDKIDLSAKDYYSLVPVHHQFHKHIDLYALKVYIQTHAERFQTAVHLRYSAGKESAYMISEEGFRAMPTEILAKMLAPDIARKLVKHIQGK